MNWISARDAARVLAAQDRCLAEDIQKNLRKPEGGEGIQHGCRASHGESKALNHGDRFLAHLWQRRGREGEGDRNPEFLWLVRLVDVGTSRGPGTGDVPGLWVRLWGTFRPDGQHQDRA